MNSLKIFSKTEWTVLLSVAFIFWFVDGALFVLLSGLWSSSASIKYLLLALIRPGVVIIITATAAVLVDSLFSALHIDKTKSLMQVIRAIILISVAFLSFIPAQIAYLATYHNVTRRTTDSFGSGVTGIFGMMPPFQIFVLLLLSICLLIVLSVYRRKKIFLLLTSVLIVGITIIAYEKLAIRDLMDEQWFKVLRMTQPYTRHDKVSPVVVFPMTKWVGKERFSQLMTIIANSNPKVIGMLKPLYWQPFGLEPDMGDTSLLTIVDPKKVVYGAGHNIYGIWNPSFWEIRMHASRSGFVPYEFPIFVNVRDRLDRGALTGLKYIGLFGLTYESGMHYTPILKNKMQQRWTEEEFDIAIPIVAKYLDQSIPQDIVQRKSWFLNSFVEIFGRRIPLTSDGTAIVNYHENSSFLVPQLDSIKSEVARIIHVGSLSKDPTKPDFFSVYDEYSDTLYHLKDGVLQPYNRDLVKPLIKPAVDRIQALEGKIVIVTVEQAGREFEQDPVGSTYTVIIDNILDNDFIIPLNDVWISAIAVVFMVFIGMMFDRWTAGKALVSALGFTTMVLLIFIVLFGLAHIFSSPFSIILPLLLTTVIFFPAEFIRERDKLHEERAMLKAELQTAHDMQMGLMPKENPTVNGFDIAGLCFPASEVGGDFYDYVWLDDEKSKLGIAVADVSGKAMKAAMTAVMTSGMIYREVGTNETPKNILKKINRPMYLKTDRRVFTALSFAVIDMRDRTLTFSNAGQMTPLLRRADTLQSIKVEGTRLPLGVMEEVEYNEVTLKLQSGDILVLFTDGIVEAKNPQEEMFGFERLETLVRSLSQEMSAMELVDALCAEATRFTGAAKQYDDMTVVVVKVK